ncbi:trans-sialidase [Trypanosoma cruzi]|nr:trans-sialidase [Trypanosoma cruzi]
MHDGGGSRRLHTLDAPLPGNRAPPRLFLPLLLPTLLATRWHLGAKEVVGQLQEFPAVKQVPLGKLFGKQILPDDQLPAHSQGAWTFRKQMVQGFLRADWRACGGWLILWQQRSPPGTAVSMSSGVWAVCAAISVRCGASPCGKVHIKKIAFELGKRWRMFRME